MLYQARGMRSSSRMKRVRSVRTVAMTGSLLWDRHEPGFRA
jgi:hypothetical protein